MLEINADMFWLEKPCGLDTFDSVSNVILCSIHCLAKPQKSFQKLQTSILSRAAMKAIVSQLGLVLYASCSH